MSQQDILEMKQYAEQEIRRAALRGLRVDSIGGWQAPGGSLAGDDWYHLPRY